MKLKQLLEFLTYEIIRPGGAEPLDREITSVEMDSRKVSEGCLFVCIKGAVFDAHSVAADVAKAGASVLVIQDDIDLDQIPADTTVIKTENTRYALACISAAWFGHPARELTTIGITGTKGKTTTTYMVKSILEKTGHKVGLIGTIEAIVGDKTYPAPNTTPESYTIQKYFREMVEAGCDCVVMEASSQGFMLHRTAGFTFDYGIFTNIERDHIGPNEHTSFEHYLECKKLLLKQCRIGIVNRDDKHFEQIIEGATCEIETYGLSEEADLRADDMKLVSGPGYLGIAYHVR
ncbi:MAG: UDP-N-acetylmuramoyl-L-alanyl-D-glutamate--2,6-diaminopimelate ligase, partial [Firmicutes bacterium]|nr:UDP-N-acetylmuramoyl-L-alanyl-D-glutamate--2,6-diaminopimelate ligase [Bacillota bacterium]